MIRKLSKDVRGQLRTGVALTSVAQATEELVLNAVDAGATCVAVRIDLPSLTLQVIDNGSGISADQLPLVGERYSTSKCHTVEDLENLRYFGYRGEALASLCCVASFLEILTRPKGSTVTYTKCFHKGKPLPVHESRTPRPSAGTTVNVRDLFYNLPVRKKSLNEGLEVEKIRYRIAGLALMWPSISFSLRDDVTGNVILQTHKCSGVLATFSSLFGGLRAKSMCEVSGQDEVFKISGYVGRENYSRKDLQFVFVNRRLVLKSKIHKVLNTVLGKSTLIKRRTTNTSDKILSQNSSTNQDRGPVVDASSPTKQFERYGVYVINIECPFSAYDITFDPAKTLVEFHDWPSVTNLIEDIILKFLREENLLLPSEQQQGGTPSPGKEGLAMPDILPESVDPFDGDTEELDEDLLVQQRQKRYTQGISAHTSLNSLFSRTVRRPCQSPSEETDGFSNPSCAKKSKPDTEQCKPEERMQLVSAQHCDAGYSDRRQVHEKVAGVSQSATVEKVQENSSATCSRKGLRSDETSHSSSSQNIVLLPGTVSSNAEESSIITLPVSTKTALPVNSQKKSLMQRLSVEAASVDSSDTNEIRLPERFAYTSSLSRLRSESRLPISSKPLASSSTAALQKFSRTKGNSSRHGKHGNATRVKERQVVERQMEDVSGQDDCGEVVLPSLKRPLMYRSKSLDAGQRTGCEQDKHPETFQNLSQKLRFQDALSKTVVSDDFNITYISMRTENRETTGKSHQRRMNATKFPSKRSLEAPSSEFLPEYSGNLYAGKSSKQKSTNSQGMLDEDVQAVGTTFSRKRNHPPALSDDDAMSRSVHEVPEQQQSGCGKGLSQASKLARLVRREQEQEDTERDQTFVVTAHLNQHTRSVQCVGGSTHDRQIPVSLSQQQQQQQHCVKDTAAIISQNTTHLSRESRYKRLTGSPVPYTSCYQGNTQTPCRDANKMGENPQQQGFFQTPHSVFAELSSSPTSMEGNLAETSCSQTSSSSTWQLSQPERFALFETPQTVFAHQGQNEETGSKAGGTRSSAQHTDNQQCVSVGSAGDSLSGHACRETENNTYGPVFPFIDSSGDAATQQNRTDSVSQSENTIPTQGGTQGFLISSSQGFVPGVVGQNSMPFDVPVTVCKDHSDSPMSTASAGFSPSVCDPMLSDSEEGKQKASSIAGENRTRKVELEEVNYISSKGALETRNTLVDGEQNLQATSNSFSGLVSQGMNETLRERRRGNDRAESAQAAVTENVHAGISSSGKAAAIQPPESSGVCSAKHPGHLTAVYGPETGFSQMSHSSANMDSLETENISKQSDSLVHSQTQAAPVADSSDITCGQRTPERASSNSHQSQSQDSYLFLHDSYQIRVPLITIPVLNTSSKQERSEQNQQNVNVSCSGASNTVYSDCTSADLASHREFQPSAGIPEISSPLSSSVPVQTEKRMMERSYDLSSLRGPVSTKQSTPTAVAPNVPVQGMGDKPADDIVSQGREEVPAESGTPTAAEKSEHRTEVSTSQQSADSFSDSVPDGALAGMAMPDTPSSNPAHDTTLSNSGTSCAPKGIPSSLFTQNAYNLGSVPPILSGGDSSVSVPIATHEEPGAGEKPYQQLSSQHDNIMASGEPEFSGTGIVAKLGSVSSISQKLSHRRAMEMSAVRDTERGEQDSQQNDQGSSEKRCIAKDHSNPVRWLPVADPKTGRRIYMNSNSGHTLTEAQWEEMELDKAETGVQNLGSKHPPDDPDEIRKCDTSELSPVSHETLDTILAEHFDEDDEESRTKWRGGCTALHRGSEAEGDSTSLAADLLSSWDNPVFTNPGQILHVAEQKQSGRAGKLAQCFLHPTAFTKEMLTGGKVIGQLDNKFVACLIQEEKTPSSSDNQTDGGLVVLFDQHAAHERVRLQQLISNVYEKNSAEDLEARVIRRTDVTPPRTVTLSEEDVRLMLSFREEFERIGIVFEEDTRRRDTVNVRTMPACMAQREANDRKRGKDPLSYEYVETMIHEHTQLLKTTAGARQQLPTSVHRLLATHACKGAIKFGDKLSTKTCQELLQALSSCDLPFQCVHGRPSIVPMLSLSQLKLVSQETKRPVKLWKLRRHIQQD